MAPRFRSRSLAGCLAAAVSLAASACMPGALPPEEPPKPVPTPINEDIQSDSTAVGTSPEDADAFVAEVQTDLKKLWVHLERTAWVKSTFITHDTELLEAAAQEQVMEYLGRRIKEARRFEGLELKPETARALHLLKLAAGLPAPDDAAKRSELASISSKMSSAYAKGKHCSPKLVGHGLPESKLPLWKRPKDGPKDEGCRNLGQLSKILAETRDEEVLREAWVGWHDTAKPLRPMYERFVETRQRRRQGNWLLRHGGDLERSLRPASRRFPEGDGAAVGRGSATVREAALLCAQWPAEEVRREARQEHGPAAGAPAGQHVGSAVGQRVPAGRAVPEAGPARPDRAAEEAGTTTPRRWCGWRRSSSCR